QIDYLPRGMLPNENSESIISIANALLPYFENVVAIRDWHPADHKNFAANHLWRKPGQIMNIDGKQQKLRPIHCVQNTFGAEYPMELETNKIKAIFNKGIHANYDRFSCFFDEDRSRSTGLREYLEERSLKNLFLIGLGNSDMLINSVLDAIELDFYPQIVHDGWKDLIFDENSKRYDFLKSKGANIFESGFILSK
ncbi:MAG: isochorismatase family protein, partial [Bacteroidetes bacterium]|nr:isochorismatase family protein [Bacteroidota bacterium]